MLLGALVEERTETGTRRPRVAKTEPTFDEFIVALKSLNGSPESNLGKHVATIVVAATLMIGAWSVSSLAAVQSTLGRMQVTMESMSKSTDEMKRDIRQVADAQSNMKAEQAQLSQRVEALEKRVGP